MTADATVPQVLDEMSWVDVAAHLARDPRLIVPIGALEHHGRHLPLGSNTLIATRVANELSRVWRVLRAPAVNYGVNYDDGQVKPGRAWSGTASLRPKTMHRALNDLLHSWESHGISEFIILTAHRHQPHIDALTTLVTREARVRVVSIWDVDLSDLVDARTGPHHAGEAETSLLLYFRPDLVGMDRARDQPADAGNGHFRAARTDKSIDGPAALAYPARASAETGRQILDRILLVIGRAVFRSDEAFDSDTL